MVKYKHILAPGISEELVREISEIKEEPKWMLDLRLNSYHEFSKKETPDWGYPYLSKDLDFSSFTYFLAPDSSKSENWEDLPEEIKNTYEALKIPEVERKYLAGVVATYDSMPVISKIRSSLKDKGIIFTDIDTAIKEYPELVQKYFMKAIPPSDNKLAALHGAVWSGGTFLYVPPGVKVNLPLQSYFRINSSQSGQFEHTIIVADKGSELTYIEGCSAPHFTKGEKALHAGVVEVYVEDNAKVKFISVENWSKNVYNLTTKRAIVKSNAYMEWIEATLGSKVSMLYPASYMRGDNSYTININLTIAPPNTWKDTGAKVLMSGSNNRAKLLSKSISIGNGVSVYRSLINVSPNSYNSIIYSQCDSLLSSKESKAITIPHNEIRNDTTELHHEAYTGSISQEKLNYLMARGMNEEDAKSLLVLGFVEDILNNIPLEFSVEIARLLKMQMMSG
ncbi:MAG: Fe-S cluster assembly protein SufB [Candidatus Parvarchaeota archaeon]|nr:Fe-S cluster assembly protein SufB [Candidatus Rehaiarchaeum fermentans]